MPSRPWTGTFTCLPTLSRPARSAQMGVAHSLALTRLSAPPAFLKPCASTLNRRVRVGQPFRSYGALGNLPASGYWLDMWRL